MIAETERLHVEKASLTDGQFFYKLMNSQNWLTYIGDRYIRSEKAAKTYIEKNLLNSYETYGYGLYKVSLKKSDTPIGICGFVKRDYLEHPDIGFAVLPEYEGHGYVFEAASAVIEYARVHLRLQPILAVTTIENERSQRLLNKIGFNQIDTIRPSESERVFLLFSSS